MAAPGIPKHRLIYERISQAIRQGEYAAGERIPPELELGQRFNVSRPTVARALRDLEREGLLVRRPGAGTYVRTVRRNTRELFGIILPHAESGICAQFCAEIAQHADSRSHAMLFGSVPNGGSDIERAEAFCEQFIAREVEGVFFIALELSAEQMHVNQRIVRRLAEAGIPVVLLDRDICAYPQRSNLDLVGIDNRHAGFVVTNHLLTLGCRNIHFMDNEWLASTAQARVVGYQDALRTHGIEPAPSHVHPCNPERHADYVPDMLRRHIPDGIICVSDCYARSLMHHLAMHGVRIPEDVRLVSIDDLPFASTLPVPLTTLRQPIAELAACAVDTMSWRIKHPNAPARHIQVGCELVVRRSCGAGGNGKTDLPSRDRKATSS